MFMLDIETTGTNKETDDVLEVAAVHMRMDNGFLVPTDTFVQAFPSCKEPSDWAKQHPAQLKLYDVSRNLHQSTPKELLDPFVMACDARFAITEFFKKCEPKEKPVIFGLNVANFDLSFLLKKSFLKEEDYSYRIFDVTPVIEFVMLTFNKRKEDRNPLIEKAFEAGYLPSGMPTGSQHGGLWDCHRQIKMLNGFMQMARSGFSEFRS